MATESPGTPTSELKNSSYELFIGALSVLSIINLVLYYVVSDEAVSTVVLIMDALLSLIFMSDFLYRLFTADSKREYFVDERGWIDLLASLPAPQLKILRMFRIVRVYRLMKIYGGKQMIKDFLGNRGGSALLVLFFLMILILEFGGLAILWVESRAPGANITTASDAVWYVYVTITTVGYGDQYPVSNTGRIIGTIIMTVGVGLFGTITAFLANIFVAPADDADESAEPSIMGPDNLQGQITEIKQLLLAYEKSNSAMMAKLEQIEGVLRESQD